MLFVRTPTYLLRLHPQSVTPLSAEVSSYDARPKVDTGTKRGGCLKGDHRVQARRFMRCLWPLKALQEEAHPSTLLASLGENMMSHPSILVESLFITTFQYDGAF